MPKARLSALCGIVLLGCATGARAASVAYVTTSQGEVSAHHRNASARFSLGRGSSVAQGDVVTTGASGRATLLFNDGSQVQMNGSTSIEIASGGGADNGLFRDIVGEAWARLRQGRSVSSRYAVAGVRGTIIDMKVADDGTTTLAVLEGEVHFYNNLGAVEVGQNQLSVVHPGSAPMAQVTFGNSEFLTQWTLDLSRAAVPRERFFISLDRAVIAPMLIQAAQRVQNNANDAQAHRALGELLFDNHQYLEALQQFNLADQFAPNDPSILCRIGYTEIELDYLDEAAAVFRRMLGQLPNQPTVARTAALSTDEVPRATQIDYSPVQQGNLYLPAAVGLAWLELTHDRPQAAQTVIETAFKATGTSLVQTADERTSGSSDEVQARVALGVALMRQPDKADLAIRAFASASALPPPSASLPDYRYQAHAWLALLYQQSGDSAAARREAQQAIAMQPQSSLAHSNQATVDFFNRDVTAAIHEARLATTLNPTSVAANVVLGQALLASDDEADAEDIAARAVALDPRLVEGYYLLGIAEAQRRDYAHATLRLRDALRLAPDFLPSASALATVYNRTGHQAEAISLLTQLEPRYHDTADVEAALGETYYQQGRYKESEDEYRQAIAHDKTNPLYFAGLARTLLDNNQLDGAISAGEEAVRLAPQVAQYHAILGKAYDFSRLSAQAERQFREALTLDPRNALSRAFLAELANDAQTSLDTYSQAFLYDPSIATELLHGGIDTEITPQIGTDHQYSIDAFEHAQFSDGKGNFFGQLDRDTDSGDRSRINTQSSSTTLRQDTTYLVNPDTNVYFDLTRSRSSEGLAGLANSPFGPNDDAGENFGFDQGVLAVKHRTRRGDSLWAGLTYQHLANTLFNPGEPPSLPFPIPLNTAFPYTSQYTSNESVIPELRYDRSLNRNPDRLATFTIGATYTLLHPNAVTGPEAILSPPTAPQILNPLDRTGTDHLAVEYAELTERFSSKFSMVAQLRQQQLDQWANSTGGTAKAGTTDSTATTQNNTLPSMLASYQANKSTAYRFILDEHVNTTELALAPTETQLITEPNILATGLPNLARIYEFDLEHQLPARAFIKLYAFNAEAYDVALGSDAPVYSYQVDPPLVLSRLQQDGIGVRYERELTRSLFANLQGQLSSSTSVSPGSLFTAQTAPYYPKQNASAALNYVSPSGNKALLLANYVGSFFDDQPNLFGLPVATSRPTFASQTYYTIELAREPSVNHEVYVGIANIFNRPAIMFNDVPVLTDTAGATRRHFFVGTTERF